MESCVFGVFNGVEAVVVGVGGDDLWEETAGGFEVVVVSFDAEGVESLGLFEGEAAEGGAALWLVGLGDLSENGFESVDIVVGGGAATGDDAKGMGAEFFRLVGGGEEFLIGGGMGFRIGLVVGGLGAEFAVFGAAGGAGRGDGAK